METVVNVVYIIIFAVFSVWLIKAAIDIWHERKLSPATCGAVAGILAVNVFEFAANILHRITVLIQ